MKSPHKTEHEDLIPRPKVARSFGVCCRTIKRWEIVKGLTPFKITSRLVGYPASQIERIKSDARVAIPSERAEAA